MATQLAETMKEMRDYPIARKDQHALTRLLFPIVAVAVATVLRSWLMPFIGTSFPTATFLLEVVFSAIQCGWPSGLLAMILSFMCANYLFVPPMGSLLPTTQIGWSGGFLFMFNSGMIVMLAEGMQRAKVKAEQNAWEAQQHYKRAMRELEERREAEQRIAALNVRLQRAMRETHHRVKNNLQVISALVDMQTFGADETVPASELQRVGQIARTLASLHDLLTGSIKEHEERDVVSVKALLEKLVAMLGETVQSRSLTLEAEEAVLPTEASSSFALLVSELVSNALKHGAGAIQIDFSAKDGQGQLRVSDEGKGFYAGFDPEVNGNVGYDLINTTVGWDLRGKLACTNSPLGGALVTVTFPLPAETPAKVSQ